MRRLLVAALMSVLAVLPRASAAQDVASPNRIDAARGGWNAIRDGRNEEAAAAFAAALVTDPRNPYLHLGAGVAAQLLGDLRKARESLERALSLAPGFTPASVLLGDLLYRESDLQGAIRVYENAVRYAPENRTLAVRLEQLHKEPSPEKGFFQSQSAHFTVLFEGPADEAIAQRAVDLLEAAYWRVGTALYTFPEQTITVVLYTEQQFRDTTRSPAWAAAAYDGRIRIPVGGALDRAPGELERVLTHELTHAMVRAIAPRGVPMWLSEGIAVMFEPEGPQWAQKTLAASEGRIPLDRLASGFEKLSGLQARIAYAESANAAGQLFEQAGGAAVVALLQDITRGVSLPEAFERHMLTPYLAFVTSLMSSRDEARRGF